MDIAITRQYADGYTHTSFQHTTAGKYWADMSADERKADAERRRVQQRYSRALALFHSFDDWQYFVTITSADATIRNNPKAMMQYAANLLRQTGVTYAISIHRNPKGTGWHAHGLTDIPVYFDLLPCNGKTYCAPVINVPAAILYILRDNRIIPRGMHTVAHSAWIKAIKPQTRIIVDDTVMHDDFAKLKVSIVDYIDDACLADYDYIMDSFAFIDDIDDDFDRTINTDFYTDASESIDCIDDTDFCFADFCIDDDFADDISDTDSYISDTIKLCFKTKRSLRLVYGCGKIIFAQNLICVNFDIGKWRPPRYHPPDASKSVKNGSILLDFCARYLILCAQDNIYICKPAL